MGRVNYLRTSAPRAAGAIVWAVALIAFCWLLADIAISGFARTATFLPLAACAGLLLAIYATLLRPGRRFGKTLALYVIAAAVVAVSVHDDLTAGAPLPAVAGLAGVLVCCWLSAGLLIFARPRKGATAPPAPPATRPLVLSGAAFGLGAVALIVAGAFGLPPLFANRTSVAAAAVPSEPAGISSVRWTSEPGRYLDYPDRLAPAGTGYIVSQANAVTAFDGATGAERWHFAVDRARGFHAAASPDGSTVVVSFRPGAGAAVADSATRLMALDAVTGATRWSRWLAGGVLAPIVSVTGSEIWLGSAEETPALAALQRINRFAIDDGSSIGAFDISGDPACGGRSVAPAIAGDRVLETVECQGALELRGTRPGDTGAAGTWVATIEGGEHSEVLTRAGSTQVGALGSLGSSGNSPVVLVSFAPGSDGVSTTLNAPSRVLSADGAELFEIPADQRPISVLAISVIAWKAGTLTAFPLDGSSSFELVGTAACTPDENSVMVGLDSAVVASCAEGSAVGFFAPGAPATVVELGLDAGADLWLTVTPGAVVVYDSISGTTVGLG